MDGDDAQGAWQHRQVTEGEWAGWSLYGEDPFEDLTGPFYYRRDDNGRLVCAFKAEKKHMNGGGFMHGGCLMTFADYALFIIAMDAPEGAGRSDRLVQRRVRRRWARGRDRRGPGRGGARRRLADLHPRPDDLRRAADASTSRPS